MLHNYHRFQIGQSVNVSENMSEIGILIHVSRLVSRQHGQCGGIGKRGAFIDRLMTGLPHAHDRRREGHEGDESVWRECLTARCLTPMVSLFIESD